MGRFPKSPPKREGVGHKKNVQPGPEGGNKKLLRCDTVQSDKTSK